MEISPVAEYALPPWCEVFRTKVSEQTLPATGHTVLDSEATFTFLSISFDIMQNKATRQQRESCLHLNRYVYPCLISLSETRVKSFGVLLRYRTVADTGCVFSPCGVGLWPPGQLAEIDQIIHSK